MIKTKTKKQLRKERKKKIFTIIIFVVFAIVLAKIANINNSKKTEKTTVEGKLTAGVASLLKDAELENVENIFQKASKAERTAEFVKLAFEVTTEVETKAETEETTVETKQTYSNEDLFWLSHVIASEVGNSTYESKAMCGLVILNRLNSPRFKAETVEEVIFSPGQYETVSNGKIYDEPDNESIEVARKILAGTIEIEIPADVVYQAEFRQGSGIYCQIGNEYYCFDD